MRRFLSWLGVWAGSASLGWSFSVLLADVSPASPAVCAIVAAGVASLWAAAAELKGMGPGVISSLWLGLAGPLIVFVSGRMAGPLSGFSFERVGLVWVFGDWVRVEPGTYLLLILLGAVLVPICLAWLYLSRDDKGKLWFAGVSTILVAAFWRTVIHPPSGDEPSLLLSAWHFWSTGSMDYRSALGTPAEIWSRAIEFREEILRYHVFGTPGGPQYTHHGIVFPWILGVVLGLSGRAGVFVLSCAVAALTVYLVILAGERVSGRPVSSLWLLALLAGSPIPVYAVFISADLWGAMFFALGILGLVSGRAWMLAVAAVALPWFHHKFFFSAAGLVLASWAVSPRAFLLVLGVFLAGFIPEVLVVSHAIDLPFWPPWEIFSRYKVIGATYSIGILWNSVPGFLVDRYVGLIYYPAWVLGLAGLVMLLRKQKAPAGGYILLAMVPFAAMHLVYSMWSGGRGAPGRMLLMVFPAMAMGLHMLETRLVSVFWRAVLKAAVWIGVAHALSVTLVPPLAFESAKLKLEAVLAAGIGFNPLSVLPALSVGVQGRIPDFVTQVWLVALLLVWVLLLRGCRRKVSHGRG